MADICNIDIKATTLNDIPEDILLKIIIFVLINDHSRIPKKLYINRIFLKLIKKYIFILPRNLKEIIKLEIPPHSSYTYIDNSSLRISFTLEEIVISNSVTYIGHRAFSNCTNTLDAQKRSAEF